MKKSGGLLFQISYWSCFSLLFACNNGNSGQQNVSFPEKKPSGDTAAAKTTGQTAPSADKDSLVFKEVTHVDFKNYFITVKEEPEEDITFLIAYNKLAKKADTAQITGRDEGDELDILDVTDSLQIKPLFLELITPSGSDWYNHSYVGYDSGKLKELFQLIDFPSPERIKLHRKDDKTLAGSVSERDDLVAAIERYPVEISLKDYKVTYPTVPAIHIGWDSKVLTGFKARRLGHEQLADSIFTVKKGSELTVDTIYTDLGKVRVIIHDSIILEIPMDKLKGKITINAAG